MSNLKVKLKRKPNYCRYSSTCGWFTLLTGFTVHRWKTKQVPDKHTHQVATCPVFVDICFVMMTLDLMLSWWSFILSVMSGALLMRNKSWVLQHSVHIRISDPGPERPEPPRPHYHDRRQRTLRTPPTPDWESWQRWEPGPTRPMFKLHLE